MSKRLLVFMLILALAALSVALVSAQDAPEGPITYASYISDPVPRAFDEQVVALWNANNPDSPVEHSTVAHEDFKQAIRAYLTASPAPDVMTWFAGERARFFVDRDLIQPFTEAYDSSGLADAYAPGFTALGTVDEDMYFLSTSYYWWAIYYRPSLFEAAGIESEPETWDEFLAACNALNAIGVAPITIGTRFPWTAAAWFDYLNMRINGPEFHISLMSLEESYTDPRVREVFVYWQQLLDNNCFIENPSAYAWQEAVNFMANEEAAMYLMGQFIADEVSANFADSGFAEDLDFFRFPIINPDVPIGEDAPTDGYFIAAGAENVAGGEAFLAFLGSQEVQQLAFDELGRLPTRTDVDISGASPATQKGINLIQTADYIAQFYDRDTTPEMAQQGMEGFMRFWDDPSQIDAILEELEGYRVRLAAELAASE